MVGHCKDTLRLGTARILGGSALLGYLAVSTAGMLCGWASQGFSAVEHCMNTPGNGRGQH